MKNTFTSLHAGLRAALFVVAAMFLQAESVAQYQRFTLHTFTGPDGANTEGPLLLGADGTLYGMTQYGGTSNRGTIFKVNVNGTGFTVLHSFGGTDLGFPGYAGLIQGRDGILYGTTFLGGIFGNGSIFKINTDGSGFSTLYDCPLSGIRGGQPMGGLIQGQGGDTALYGTTSNSFPGSGSVFRINTDGTGYTALHNFIDAAGGRVPVAGLAQTNDGTLYGSTIVNGGFGYGTIFKLNPDGSGFSVLYSFRDIDGTNSRSRLVVDPTNNTTLYGSGIQGGAFNAGSIFKVNIDGTGYAKLYDYSVAAGFGNEYGIVLGRDGALYGATSGGGLLGRGAVFRISTDGTGFTSLYTAERSSHTGVTEGADGTLFGGDSVSVFKLSPNAPPTAVAGANQPVRIGVSVTLNGSGSYDDNTLPALLAYSWNFVSVPVGSGASLQYSNTATPDFIPDLLGDYVVQLIVTDGAGLQSAPAFVTLSNFNQAPTSVASVTYSLAVVGQAAQFDGSASTDPEHDALAYSWSITGAPAGSTAVLAGAQSPFPTLTPDLPGDYEVTLTVSDFLGFGTPAKATITASTASSFAEVQVIRACDIVDLLAANQVRTKGNQTAFCNFIRQAVSDLQKGKTANAIGKINNAIERTDGFILRGSIDGNGPGMDWIIDPAAQAQIYHLLVSAIQALAD